MKRTTDSLIKLPTAVNAVSSRTVLAHSVFRNLDERSDDMQWLALRAILTPTNTRLQSINKQVAECFLVNFSHYKSAESVVCDSLQAQKPQNEISPRNFEFS